MTSNLAPIAYKTGLRWLSRTYVVLRSISNLEQAKDAAQRMAFRQVAQVRDPPYIVPSMAVTEFITQYSELRQIEEFMTGQRRPQTAAMIAGTEIHSQLEDQAAELREESDSLLVVRQTDDGPGLVIECETLPLGELAKGDLRFIDYINKIMSLAAQHDRSKALPHWKHSNLDLEKPGDDSHAFPLVRELPIYGCTNMTPNFELRGIIDGVRIHPVSGIEIIETKTTRSSPRSSSLVQLAYHQLLVYHRLFSSLLREGTESSEYLLDRFHVSNPLLKRFVTDEPISEMIRMANVKLHDDVQVSPKVQIEVIWRGHSYFHEATFDEATCQQVLQSRTDLFSGKRVPFNHLLSDALDEFTDY